MNTKYINIVLIVGILVVIGGAGFFGWKALRVRQVHDIQPVKKEFAAPTPITNTGKESEDRDAAMERDIRKINDAVEAYAKDHTGAYPESDFKNPCSGVRYCLKGVDINTKKKAYLEKVPQVQPYGTDYYYRAYSAERTYCIKTPSILETAVPNIFQCTRDGCGKALIAASCR